MNKAARAITSFDPPAPYSDEGRQQITALLMALFEKWKLDTKSQLNLLGMKDSSRAVLSKYRHRERAIPDDIDKLNRAGLLLLIHKCLRLLFPENPNIVYTWIKRKNKAFDYRAPLDIIKEHGLLGLAKIARYLELELIR